MAQREQEIVIGRVVAPFGLRGEVKVIVLTDFPERFGAGNEITIRIDDDKRRKVRIDASRPNKGGLTIKLKGIETRNDAEELRDSEVVIDQSELAELPSDRFYVFDIIGLKVVTDDGRELGEVADVLQGGANDVYVTSTGLYIPAIKDVVTKIDIKAGLMVIRPMPGLLPDE
ncbi:MAG: ribosome maturation factor RimM [Armatimonadetes bacterium]|nr:ribosome maturation factor RimM [Armatimonadota bacterium]